ncbi:digestive organ expansion factor [Rhodotorula toruloides]|uniref:U3 small nucleolar RNA-associated protein 25 n=1 Tax=Rhodotorula toruloides TaxID=5286 RepID=A0A511KE40_RHOTO|nr:digestive organ expansion factor [Rhodotorula toruloides]
MKTIADPRLNLLTILNVQSARSPTGSSGKRPAVSPAPTRDWHAIARKAQKKAKGASAGAERARRALANKVDEAAEVIEEQEDAQTDDAKVEAEDAAFSDADSGDETAPSTSSSVAKDPFAAHFGPESALVEGKEAAQLEEEEKKWSKGKSVFPGAGEIVWMRPEGVDSAVMGEDEALKAYNPKLVEKLRMSSGRSAFPSIPPTQSAWLRTLSTCQDVLFPKVEVGSDEHDAIREACAMHAMNLVLRTRSRILKNNEFLARSALDPSSSSAPPRNTQDQSFTRPKVLLLTPFRNSALTWVQHLVSYLPPTTSLIESYPRFVSEYSLPEGASDKLVERADEYPRDHVETFKGNIDDTFRCGIKVTRKAAKMFSEFYQADVIVASPLGLRTSIEKDGDSDFLSSIEILIVDQMDVILMQNWEHVQFVMERLNKMPEEDHGCDFSRVKPWYLDGKAAHLRQSILLSSFDSPELRALFTRSCHNRSGKLRAIPRAPNNGEGVLVMVPRGLRQVWSRFEGGEVWEEDEKRFEFFTTKTLPTLLKSAVSSSQTLIFVPSYFDFVRLKRYLQKNISRLGSDFSFAAISEYSDTPEISRARGAFFQGKKKFLLVTERFHFFRRYRLRGAKTFVFYAPPLHPLYYPEVLAFPFTAPSSLPSFQPSGDADVDESELSSHVLFSKYDVLRVERIVGTKDARRMCGLDAQGDSGEKRFTFV